MSLARLYALQELAERHDPALASWLAEAWARYLAGLPLDQALELRGLRARNAALMTAADLIDPELRMSARELARRIERAVDWFERQASRLGDREELRDPLLVALHDMRFAAPAKRLRRRQLEKLLARRCALSNVESARPSAECSTPIEASESHDDCCYGPAVLPS